MPVLVRADVNRSRFWVKLRFPYNKPFIEELKTYPGSRWDPGAKAWDVPLDVVEGVLIPKMGKSLTVCEPHLITATLLDAPGPLALKPFQIETAKFLLSHPVALANLDMRLGKTPTSLTAARSLAAAGIIDAICVCYPASVQGEWIKQAKDWMPEIPFIAGEGLSVKQDIVRPKGPFALGIHYEILRDWAHRECANPNCALTKRDCSKCGTRDLSLFDTVMQDRRVLVIFDEIQWVKNRKGGRFDGAMEIARRASWRWGLSGTPMRNRNRDLYGVLSALNPGCMGDTYSKFATRYCDYHVDDLGYWDDHGQSNVDELRARMATFTIRRTRQDVAGQLPKAQRSIVHVRMGTKEQKEYKKLQAAFAPMLGGFIEDAESLPPNAQDAINGLVGITTGSKIPMLLERLEHYVENGHKVVVFSHLHETTDKIMAAISEKQPDWKYWLVDGRVTKEKRRVAIEDWRKCDGGVLIAGTLAAGIGIDLSDATAAIFIELEWVPADFRQAEDRIVDVHQGKRTTPPIYEYLICEGTIDEAMIRAIVSKLNDIDRVIGRDAESSDMKSKLAGVVEGSTLDPNDNTAVKAALLAMRDRILGRKDGEVSRATLAAQALGDSWGDDEADEEGASDQGEV